MSVNNPYFDRRYSMHMTTEEYQEYVSGYFPEYDCYCRYHGASTSGFSYVDNQGIIQAPICPVCHQRMVFKSVEEIRHDEEGTNES